MTIKHAVAIALALWMNVFVFNVVVFIRFGNTANLVGALFAVINLVMLLVFSRRS
jgi:hypothetical protein